MSESKDLKRIIAQKGITMAEVISTIEEKYPNVIVVNTEKPLIDKTKNFVVMVDCTKTIDEMIATAKFDRVSEIIKGINYPLLPYMEGQKIQTEMRLFPADHLGCEAIEKEMQEAGYWPSVLAEGLALVIEHPEFKKEGIIISGSTSEKPSNPDLHYIVGLRSKDGKNELRDIDRYACGGGKCFYLGTRKPLFGPSSLQVYYQPLENMFGTGEYTRTNKEIDSFHFPCPEKLKNKKITITAEPLCFGSIHFEDIEEEINKKGYEPANINEIIDFASSHDFKYRLFATGSVQRSRFPNHIPWAPCVFTDSKQRYVGMAPFNGKCGHRDWHLGVKRE